MARRSLEELINKIDPGWPLVQEWIATASNHVEVLSVERARAEEVLLHLQVTTRSPMGAIALETGGVLVDHGWLRVLGSGHQRICGNLLSWNSGEQELRGACIIAYDVIGGFFALNGGAFPGQQGAVFYFAPDALKWKSLDLSYSQFLNWALTGDVQLFYQDMRWPDWKQDLLSLNGDQGIFIYPFLFTERNLPIAERSRRTVPLRELWHLYIEDQRNGV